MALKILISTNAMWASSGYGQASYYLTKIWRNLGHEVAVFAYFGLEGGTMVYDGMKIYPKAIDAYGNDIVEAHAAHFGADIVISNVDVWVLSGWGNKKFHWYPLVPVAEDPLTGRNRGALQGATGICALSKYGQRVLESAGFKAAQIYLPVPTQFYCPLDKRTIKRSLGWDEDTYVIGHIGMNRGYRKGIDILLSAFQVFLAEHPNSLLYLHTDTQSHDGLGLDELLDTLGIRNKVVTPTRYDVFNGKAPQWLLGLYNSLDLYVQPSLSEGQAMPVWESMSCFPYRTLVDTIDGLLPIAEIQEGQYVLDHKGDRNKVLKVISRVYTGPIVQLNIYGKQDESIECTPEHPWLVRRGEQLEFIQARDILLGDFLCLPKEKHTYNPTYVDTTPFEKEGSNQFGTKFPHPRVNRLGQIQLTPEFMRFCGLWVAEGSAGKAGVNFAFHANEKEYHQAVLTEMEKLGIHTKVYITGNSATVVGYSYILERFLKSEFGAGAHYKHVPLWVKQLPKELLIPFIRGVWEGDGSFFIDRCRYIRTSYGTVSEQLAYDLRAILLRLGIYANVDFRKNGSGFNKKNEGSMVYSLRVNGDQVNWISELFGREIFFAYTHPTKSNNFHYFDEDYCYTLVQDIQADYVENLPVYNLQIEGSASYNVYGFAVHNCGVPVVATNCTALSEILEGDTDGILIEPSNKLWMPQGGFGYEVTIDSLASAMLQAFENYGPNYVSVRNRQRAIENVSLEVLSHKWQAELSRLEKIVRFQPSYRPFPEGKPRVVQVSTIVPNCGIGAYTRQLMSACEGATEQQCVDVQTLRSADQIPDCDLVHWHWEAAISPPESLFRDTLWNLRLRGIPILMTFHSMRTDLINEMFAKNLISLGVVHWLIPGIKVDERMQVLGGMGCPMFNPPALNEREDMRARFGFSPFDTIISTFGFASAGRGHYEVLEQIAPFLKTHPNFKLQLILPANFLNERGKDFVHEKIRAIARQYQIEQQIHLIEDYIPDLEVMQRLWISDVGYLFIETHTLSSSAAIRFFISARCPLVANDSTHFADVPRGVHYVKTFNLTEFSQEVLLATQNRELLGNLKGEHEQTYEQFVWPKFAEKYLAYYKQCIGPKTIIRIAESEGKRDYEVISRKEGNI